ncbi:MAG: hypothetical protein WCI38_11000 [Chthoniobacterales bacterium]
MESQYDFGRLAAQMKKLHDQGRMFTVQVNGNEKPSWLFERVPCLPEPLNVQVHDAQGTLMYWHPAFERAYLNFLHAYATFLKQSPYRTSVLGVRQNFNAIGTEHWHVPGNKVSLSQWRVPSGAHSGKPFTQALGRVYQTRGVKNAGPDDQRFGAWSWLLPRDQAMELKLDDSFATSLATQAAELRVTYLDQGDGEFDVRAAGRTFHTQCSDSGRWQTVAWDLSRPAFGRADSDAHPRLDAIGADLNVHMVEVVRKELP